MISFKLNLFVSRFITFSMAFVSRKGKKKIDVKTVDKKECGGYMIKNIVLSNRKFQTKDTLREVISNAGEIIGFPTFLHSLVKYNLGE